MSELRQLALTAEQTIELNNDIKQILKEVDQRYQAINNDKQDGSQPIMIVHELLKIGYSKLVVTVQAKEDGVGIVEIRGFTSQEAAERFISAARASMSLYYMPTEKTVH